MQPADGPQDHSPPRQGSEHKPWRAQARAPLVLEAAHQATGYAGLHRASKQAYIEQAYIEPKTEDSSENSRSAPTADANLREALPKAKCMF